MFIACWAVAYQQGRQPMSDPIGRILKEIPGEFPPKEGRVLL